jgi:hypothetical protein
MFQWVPAFFSGGWGERDFDHSPPFREEVKNEWSYTSPPLVAFTVWTRTIFLYLNNLRHVACIKMGEN